MSGGAGGAGGAGDQESRGGKSYTPGLPWKIPIFSDPAPGKS